MSFGKSSLKRHKHGSVMGFHTFNKDKMSFLLEITRLDLMASLSVLTMSMELGSRVNWSGMRGPMGGLELPRGVSWGERRRA